MMPDHRKHRGPHPADHELFHVDQQQQMRSATRDLSWLLTRGYAPNSSLKIVGDRYSLVTRQRLAVARCACSDLQVKRRQQRRVAVAELQHQELWIDGYNVLTSIEAAMSGGVILHARDDCYRDMASMHGSYRKVSETVPAIEHLGSSLSEWNVPSCRWLLDKPVSNSGRLKTLLASMSEKHAWQWRIELVRDPDSVLSNSDHIVATADSQILDAAPRWFNLAREVIDAQLPHTWTVRLAALS